MAARTFIDNLSKEKRTLLEDRCRGVLRIECDFPNVVFNNLSFGYGLKPGLNKIVQSSASCSENNVIAYNDSFNYYCLDSTHFNRMQKLFNHYQEKNNKVTIRPRAEKLYVQTTFSFNEISSSSESNKESSSEDAKDLRPRRKKFIKRITKKGGPLVKREEFGLNIRTGPIQHRRKGFELVLQYKERRAELTRSEDSIF